MPIASVPKAEAAAHLLDPRRARILELARQPASASDIAEGLGWTRQRVAYHLRELEEDGLLVEAGRREKRNFTEVLYTASAASYLVAPEALGPLAPDLGRPDAFAGADRLLALAARTQSEAARVRDEGGLLALDLEAAFPTPAARDLFLRELREAAAALAARHGGRGGLRQRVVVVSHPAP